MIPNQQLSAKAGQHQLAFLYLPTIARDDQATLAFTASVVFVVWPAILGAAYMASSCDNVIGLMFGTFLALTLMPIGATANVVLSIGGLLLLTAIGVGLRFVPELQPKLARRMLAISLILVPILFVGAAIILHLAGILPASGNCAI